MKKSIAGTLYENFSGRKNDEEIIVNISSCKNLTLLGKAISVSYKVSKHNDRKEHIYCHEFENDQLLVTNGKEILIVSPGNKTKITERGIEG